MTTRLRQRATAVALARFQSGAQRALLAVADRYNYFLVKGMYHPRSRFRHRVFMEGKPWYVARDLVRYATVELLNREIRENGVDGAVAELGVCRGEFAAILSQHFPDRALYLFDTFEGFDARDVSAEVARGLAGVPYDLPPTTPELVLSGLPHPERAVVRPGWFPESAVGCEAETFCFVSIDVGLYQPTYQGLRWFHPRLCDGGYVLVTDYNNAHCKGVKQAVRQFAHEEGVAYATLPDFGATAVLMKPARQP